MATEYSRFYPKATHVLFAVVVATSFQSATTTLIPIFDALEPPNLMATTTLAISYAVVILGWARYARSESRWQYGDTRLGGLRFAFDLVTLFIYFYLLQIATNEYVDHFVYVMFALAVMYLASELARYFDHLQQQREPHQVRILPVIYLFVLTGAVTFVIEWYMRSIMIGVVKAYPQLQMLDSTAVHLLAVLLCFGLIVWYTRATWKIREGAAPSHL